MGDRYHWHEKCQKCKGSLLVYYAESSEVTTVTCPHCKTEYEIVMSFKLRKKHKLPHLWQKG